MKYALVELYRREIGLYFYDDNNGIRAFETINSSIPLAIAYNGRELEYGQPALDAVQQGRQQAYSDLFDLMDAGVKCNNLPSRMFVVALVRDAVGDLATKRMFNIKDMTLVLLCGNDVLANEVQRIANALQGDGYAEVKTMFQSVESVKYLRHVDNWSREIDAMVVRSDNKDLSVKCFSLSDFGVKYEHIFKGRGKDPRFEWASEDLWNTLRSQTWTNEDEALPIISAALEAFLKSNQFELTSIRLPDGNYPVYLSKQAFETYSPPDANQFVSMISDIVQQVGLQYETTGIALQGRAANNRFFRNSFSLFDPISNETDEDCEKIRSQVLKQLLGIGGPAVVNIPKVSIVDINDSGFYFNVEDSGGAIVTERGVCWSLSHNPTTADLTCAYGQGTGRFFAEMDKLSEGQVYYVRAYAKNEAGVGYSEEKTFPSEAEVSDDPNDDGKRKFRMEYSIDRQGINRTVTITAEILDKKKLPCDSIFTLATSELPKYNPEKSFCVECKRGKGPKLEFGPYELSELGLNAATELHTRLWPANPEISPNYFKNTHLKIKL